LPIHEAELPDNRFYVALFCAYPRENYFFYAKGIQIKAAGNTVYALFHVLSFVSANYFFS